ncbi:MAG: phosphoadenosine phosphosulfate reductase family protein [Proteobacteria bacterium]|nr:phosphoadenosine phosphosulfate reductase family protein [Pseudomonadota bacterium]
MPTLEAKIDAARALLVELLKAHGPERVAVAWTGGKDSTMALDLWRGLLLERGLGPARALSIDTGLKFPEIVAFRDQWAATWDLDLRLVRPLVDIATYPVAQDKIACCTDLKVTPLRQAIEAEGVAVLVTGLRRDEHSSRHNRDFLEQRTNPDHVQANILLDFTEMDIWAYTTARALPFCSLYGVGYRSLGCMPCTELSGAGERSGRDDEKESHLDTLRSLGYF